MQSVYHGSSACVFVDIAGDSELEGGDCTVVPDHHIPFGDVVYS